MASRVNDGREGLAGEVAGATLTRTFGPTSPIEGEVRRAMRAGQISGAAQGAATSPLVGEVGPKARVRGEPRRPR